MLTKVCSKCGEEKDLNLFVVVRRYPDGHGAECKECHNKHNRDKYWKNPEVNRKRNCENVRNAYKRNPNKFREKAKVYRESKLNKDEKSEYMREYRKRNKENIKAYKKDYEKTHPEIKRKMDITYRKKNRSKLNEKSRKYRNSTPENKLKHNLRNRIRFVLKGLRKGGHLHELTGCGVEFLKKYITSLFTEGMNWDNYGQGEGKWNVDHIIPLEKFTLSDIEQQKEAFHWTNLQPMWGKENSSKGSLYNGVRYYKRNHE